jgi:hypothetical protein
MKGQPIERAAPTPATHPSLAYRREGRRWRGKLQWPRHAHPVVRRLYAEANEQRTTLSEIADRAGLRPSTISQWGNRNHPRLDQIEAALNALDLDLVVVPRGGRAARMLKQEEDA